jgi:hypothetical protein
MMKITNTENYFKFLKEGIKERLQDLSTYMYLVLFVIAELIFFFKDGWNNAINISLLLTTGIMFLWIAVELIFVLIRNKTFNRNIWLSYSLVALVLIPLNYLIFSEHQRYWSFVSGLLFLIPVIVSVVFSKIYSWFR